MATSILEVGLRYTPDRATMMVTQPSAGSPVAVTLPAGQLDLRLATVAATIQSALQTQVDPGFTCTCTAGKFTVAHAGGFDLSITRPELGTALGWTDQTGVSSYQGTTSPLYYAAVHPWDSTLRLVWQTVRARWDHGQGRGVKINRIREWEIKAIAGPTDRGDLRGVLSLMSRGLPATWYRSSGTTSSWNYGNWWGRVSVVLASAQDGYSDGWMSGGNARLTSTHDLILQEYAP